MVAVNTNGDYEVWEASGRLINNLRPALKIADPRSADELARRLTHLTKYNNVKLLENCASTSPLARQITVEVVEETAKGPGGGIILDDGEHLTFRIRNNTPSQALNVTKLAACRAKQVAHAGIATSWQLVGPFRGRLN